MSSSDRPKGKPDLAAVEDILRRGNEEGSGTRQATPVNTHRVVEPDVPLPQPVAPTTTPKGRVVKESVSLRLPQYLKEWAIRTAATETLETGVQVTPHDVYVRSIAAAYDKAQPK